VWEQCGRHMSGVRVKGLEVLLEGTFLGSPLNTEFCG
jgi:hypothetical protein